MLQRRDQLSGSAPRVLDLSRRPHLTFQSDLPSRAYSRWGGRGLLQVGQVGSSLPHASHPCLLLTSRLGLCQGKLSIKWSQMAHSHQSQRALCCQVHWSPAPEAWLGLLRGESRRGRLGTAASAWLGGPLDGWKWAYVFQAGERCFLCGPALCPHRSPVKRDRW